MHRFPPLAPQARQTAARPQVRALTRSLPQISLPWLEIGLAVLLVAMLSFG